MSWKLWSAIGATVVSALALAAPATADVRTATVNDGADPTVALDLEQARAALDRGASRLTVTVRLHGPWPEKPDFSTGATLWLSATDPSNCISGQAAAGDTYINIGRPVTGTFESWEATYNVKHRQEYRSAAVAFSADRREATVTIADPLYAAADIKCVAGSSNGRATYDPTQPNGGPEYDTLEPSWFDGFAPVAPAPPAAPGPPGTPGSQLYPACSSADMKLTPPPSRLADHRDAQLRWRTRGYGAKLVGITVTQTMGGSDPLVQTSTDESSFLRLLTVNRRKKLKINVRWTMIPSFEDAPCSGERTFSVHGIAGDPPRVRDAGNEVRMAVNAAACDTTDDRRIKVRLSGPGGTRRSTLSWACGRWSRGVGSPSEHLAVRSRGGGEKRPAKLTFTAGASGNYAKRWTLTIRYGGRVARRTVRVSSTYVPRERVYAWHGTSVNDEYWNYCVNEGKQTWMDDGNAYCIRPAYRDQSAWITGG